MDVLRLCVEDQHAAVLIAAAEADALARKQLAYQLTAELAKVARDDEIVFLRGTVKIVKMLPERLKGRRRHGRTHVVCVLDACVNNGADGRALQTGAFALSAENDCARACDRPLRRRRALPAVAQREAILAF